MGWDRCFCLQCGLLAASLTWVNTVVTREPQSGRVVWGRFVLGDLKLHPGAVCLQDACRQVRDRL